MAEIYNALEVYQLEKFLNKIAEVILQRNVSLFIGAGSSMQYGAMNWDQLIDAIFDGNKNWSNTERAEYAELNGRKIKEDIANVISEIYIDVNKTNTYLNYLLDFDYKSLWTTNYDCVIEDVLDNKSKVYIPIYEYSHFPKLSYPGGYFLYKINGCKSEYKTIVITREDFVDYRKSHEAYLLLLKRELLCNSFLFLGCSFDDDILRICIKDILNCIDNSKENYSTNHFAVVVESDVHKLDFISKDMQKHYNINCLMVDNPAASHKIAYGISCKVRFNSIFVSGAKRFERYSQEENNGKRLCQELVNEFFDASNFPFKFISGMGMSIGHFISGTIKEMCKGKNLNRYLQMEPFPFSSAEANKRHRENMINKAGIFIFIYGDTGANESLIEQSGMWKEYILAKAACDSIIIPLPCGEDSISDYIFKQELKDDKSFAYEYKSLLNSFDYNNSNKPFFIELVEKIRLSTRKKMDYILQEIVNELHAK